MLSLHSYNEMKNFHPAGWPIPLTTAPWRQGHVNLSVFKTSLVYMAVSRPAGLHSETLSKNLIKSFHLCTERSNFSFPLGTSQIPTSSCTLGPLSKRCLSTDMAMSPCRADSHRGCSGAARQQHGVGSHLSTGLSGHRHFIAHSEQHATDRTSSLEFPT